MANQQSKAEKEFKEAQEQLQNTLNENERLKAELEKSESENRELIRTNVALEKKVEELKVFAPKEDEDLVEIVAIPANPNVKVVPKTEKGKKVREEVDKDGFHHYFVSRNYAKSLLGATSGLKHVLVGPDRKMTFDRMRGLYSEKVTVYRHVKSKSTKGHVQWIPSIDEDEEKE